MQRHRVLLVLMALVTMLATASCGVLASLDGTPAEAEAATLTAAFEARPGVRVESHTATSGLDAGARLVMTLRVSGADTDAGLVRSSSFLSLSAGLVPVSPPFRTPVRRAWPSSPATTAGPV